MVKKTSQTVQKVGGGGMKALAPLQKMQKLKGVQKAAPPQKLHKAQVGKQQKVSNNERASLQKNKKLKHDAKIKLEKEIKKESEEENEDDNEEEEDDEEDSGADVVAEEEEEEEDDDDDDEEEDDDDSSEGDEEAENIEDDKNKIKKIKMEFEEDDDDDDSEEEEEEGDEDEESGSDDDAPEEQMIKKLIKSEDAPKKTSKTANVKIEDIKKENPSDDCTVCVKQFGDKVTDADILSYFSNFGKVERITMRRDKGYCFVSFTNSNSAKAALGAHKSQLNGVVIGVFPKVKNPKELTTREPKKTVLLKNVDKLKTITSEELTPIFSKYGEITDLEIICGKNVLAFVTYKNAESAEKCMELNNKTVNKIKLEINPYQTLNYTKTTVFVQNVKPGVTKEEIEELFSQVGPIENAFVKSGFAIVKFKDSDSFCKSFMLNETVLHGQMIFLEPHSTKKQQILKSKNHQKRPMPYQNGSHQKRFKMN